MKNVNRAITFRASSIGDCLMGKYLLENIHAAFPKAELFLLLAGKGDMARDLLSAYPWINIIEANRKNPRKIFETFKNLYPSDISVTQYSGRGQFSLGSKIFARFLTRSGGLAGFTDTFPLNNLIYDHLIEFDSRRALRLHERDALSALGITPMIKKISLKVKDNINVLKENGLKEKEYIVLNLFSGSPKRGLSLSHQIDIARAVVSSFGERKKVALTGGSFDKPTMAKIKEVVPGIINLPGLKMAELINLISKSGGVVSLDTGVAHIGAQTETPLVVLRTCLGYNWWTKDQYDFLRLKVLAHDELCANGHAKKDFPDCLAAISTSEIISAAEEIFQ